jgi:hypothetical protein
MGNNSLSVSRIDALDVLNRNALALLGQARPD